MVRDFENIDFSLLMSDVKKEDCENSVALKNESTKPERIGYTEDAIDFTGLCIRDTVRA